MRGVVPKFAQASLSPALACSVIMDDGFVLRARPARFRPAASRADLVSQPVSDQEWRLGTVIFTPPGLLLISPAKPRVLSAKLRNGLVRP